MAEIYVGNTGKNWYLSCEEASFTQSVANNTSTLVLVLYLRCESSAYTVSFDRRSAWIGSNTYTPAYSHSGGKHELGRTTYTITHNADGTASFSVGYGISTSYALNGSGTYTRTIPTIPRASSISSITGNMLGSAVTVKISRASSGFTHEVTYTFGNVTKTIATACDTSCTFTPNISDAAQIPDATSGTATIKVQTKSGTTNIGAAVSKTFTLNVPTTVVPSFSYLSVARVDNGVPTDWGIYVAGYTKATLSITGAVGAQGSKIVNYSITGANYASATNSLTTGVLPAGKLTFTGTIIDSRGRTATKTIDITVVTYTGPSLTMTVQRCLSSGEVNNNGTYVIISPVYSYAAIGDNGIASRKFEVVGTSYNDTTCNSGSHCVLGDNSLSTAKSYTIRGTITDKLNNSSTISVTLPTAMKTMNIKSNGKGVAFGKISETDNTLESAWNFIAPTMVASGIINAGILQQGGTALNTLIANSVNAQPQILSSGGWISFKFPSGLQIAIFKADITKAFNTWTSGATAYMYIPKIANFPQSFSSAPTIHLYSSLNATEDGYFSVVGPPSTVNVVNTSTDSIGYITTSNTGLCGKTFTVTIGFTAIGRWK